MSWVTLAASVLMILTLTGEMPVVAQQAGAPSEKPSEKKSGEPAPGMMGGHMGHMEMVCPMMGGGMGMMPRMSPMMGGRMGMGADPKTTGRMLQMRAEMMKAMADVMLKHGKAMEEEAK